MDKAQINYNPSLHKRNDVTALKEARERFFELLESYVKIHPESSAEAKMIKQEIERVYNLKLAGYYIDDKMQGFSDFLNSSIKNAYHTLSNRQSNKTTLKFYYQRKRHYRLSSTL